MLYTFVGFCVIYYLLYKVPIGIWVKKDRLRFAIFIGVSYLMYFILNITVSALVGDRMAENFEQISFGILIAVLMHLIGDVSKGKNTLQKNTGNPTQKQHVKKENHVKKI